MIAITETRCAFAAVLGLIASASLAHGYKTGSLSIQHPWSRETATGQAVGGGFMIVNNASAILGVQRSDPAAEHHQQMQDADQEAPIKRHPRTAILAGPRVRVSTSPAGQFSSGQEASCWRPDDAWRRKTSMCLNALWHEILVKPAPGAE